MTIDSRAVLLGLVLSGPVASPELHAQASLPLPAASDSAVVVPDGRCRASPLFAALAGGGHRDLWSTPISIPVADLATLSGGLIPVRVGGGMTTETLHLDGGDGRRYVFRSVRKNTRQALEEEFWGTPVEAVMRDQLCSFHPTGAPVVSRLLEAVDVLHPEPRFFVLPDDPSLGEFREQFAGMLVLFEERPDDGPDGTLGFAGSRRISQTEDLFDELEEHPLDRVDTRELLRSRLVDLLVGDRDRSINNHLWARFDLDDGGHLWRPVPRDRDQAFVRFDGIIKSVGRLYDPRLVSFGDRLADVEGLTRNAWDIDRNLLVGLSRAEWDSTVVAVRAALTDEVIHSAVERMPPAHHALLGREMETRLRARRDGLARGAEALYEIVFREADVRGSDQDEEALLRWVGGGTVSLVLRRRASPGEAVPPPHFRREFHPSETREVRLFLHGGDDRILLEGGAPSPIRFRVIGGGGEDELVNRAPGARVLFYDEGDDTRLDGEDTRLIRRSAGRSYSWWVDGAEPPDFGSRRWPRMSIGYDGDRGPSASIGVSRERYGFGASPYRSRTEVGLGWALGRSEPLLEARHHQREALGSTDLELRARYSGFEVVRFYGLGNETPADRPEEFYEVHQRQAYLAATLGVEVGPGLRLGIGPTIRSTSSDTTDPRTLVTESRVYGTGDFLQAGLEGTLDLDRRDHGTAPTRGFRIQGGGSWFPAGLDVDRPFGELHGEAALYSSPFSEHGTLALRVGGRHLWGRFPYSDAAFLGGRESVRGLPEQRYAGRASLHGSAELRLFLGRFRFLFPMDLGGLALLDAGRVFVDGDGSNRWHTSRGGGIWLAPVSRSATVHFTLAESEGHRAFYAGVGFSY